MFSESRLRDRSGYQMVTLAAIYFAPLVEQVARECPMDINSFVYELLRFTSVCGDVSCVASPQDHI